SGSGGSEGGGEGVASFGSANEEKGLAGSFRDEGFCERFGYVLSGEEIDCQTDFVSGAEGGGTDGGDVPGELGEVEKLGATVKGFDGVGAGEDQPVVGAEAGEGGVEGGEGGRGGDLDGGDENGGGTEGFELGG